MMYWLKRIVMICIVLGTIQWGIEHPDSELSRFAVDTYYTLNNKFWALEAQVRAMLSEGLTYKNSQLQDQH